jgi:hypothetical protein
MIWGRAYPRPYYGSYLIPTINNLKQEQRRQFAFCRQEYQMFTAGPDFGRAHLLDRIASEFHQKRFVRHTQIMRSICRSGTRVARIL